MKFKPLHPDYLTTEGEPHAQLLLRDDFVVSGPADLLVMCGCKHADFMHPRFTITDVFDVDYATFDRWQYGLVAAYLNARDAELDQHQALIQSAIARVYPVRESGTGAQLMHLHKSLIVDFVRYYGYTLPAEVRAFVKRDMTDLDFDTYSFRGGVHWMIQSFFAGKAVGLFPEPIKPPSKKEDWYRDALHSAVGGEAEVTLGKGAIADVVTDEAIYEVKTLRNWDKALGQLARYQYFAPGKKKIMVLFGKSKSACLQTIADTAADVQVIVYFMSDDAVLNLITPDA